MRAHKASIQTAATKVTDIGDIFSGGSSVYSPRQIPILPIHIHIFSGFII